MSAIDWATRDSVLAGIDDLQQPILSPQMLISLLDNAPFSQCNLAVVARVPIKAILAAKMDHEFELQNVRIGMFGSVDETGSSFGLEDPIRLTMGNCAVANSKNFSVQEMFGLDTIPGPALINAVGMPVKNDHDVTQVKEMSSGSPKFRW